MTHEPENNPTLEPYKKGQPCGRCGSKDWADCKLSPKDLKPVSCDRCPPKKTEERTHRTNQVLE